VDDLHNVIADFRLPIADLNVITSASPPFGVKRLELLLEKENHDRDNRGSLFQLEIANRQSAML
jgi:hypothetical protein